jgi:hypothetical protein
MKGDDYTRGRHFWIHFSCGLVVGSILGTRIIWQLFESGPEFFGLAALIALAFACAVGYWETRCGAGCSALTIKRD